jgi:DNA-binding protein H-NS
MTTYRELLAQQAKLSQQIEMTRATEVETVIAQLKQVIADYGLTAKDLGLPPIKIKSRRPATPKYRDPKSGATWSGRGHAPAWIAGKDYARYLIK